MDEFPVATSAAGGTINVDGVQQVAERRRVITSPCEGLMVANER